MKPHVRETERPIKERKQVEEKKRIEQTTSIRTTTTKRATSNREDEEDKKNNNDQSGFRSERISAAFSVSLSSNYSPWHFFAILFCLLLKKRQNSRENKEKPKKTTVITNVYRSVQNRARLSMHAEVRSKKTNQREYLNANAAREYEKQQKSENQKKRISIHASHNKADSVSTHKQQEQRK